MTTREEHLQMWKSIPIAIGMAILTLIMIPICVGGEVVMRIFGIKVKQPEINL